MLRPQPLRVTGEPLVQPDVAPARETDAVAEPLVGEFVRHEALGGGDEVVHPEDGEALGLERDLELIGRHDEGAASCGYGPNNRSKRRSMSGTVENARSAAAVSARGRDDHGRHAPSPLPARGRVR